MIIFTHPACLAHDPGPEHPERPARLEVVLEVLRREHGDVEWREAPMAKLGDLRRVHDEALVNEVLDADVAGPIEQAFAKAGADSITVGEAVASLGMVAEGVKAAKIAWELTNAMGIRSPLIQGVYKVVHEQLEPRVALRELMSGAAQDDIDPSLFRVADVPMRGRA